MREERKQRILKRYEARHAVKPATPSFVDYLLDEYRRLPKDAAKDDYLFAFTKADQRHRGEWG